jgi:excisionase family DNA binding protein
VTESLVTAADIAEMLGFSPGTILDWFETGRLPGFKIGRAVRFRESEVLAWLEAQRSGPGTGGTVSPAPTVRRPSGVVSHLSPVPLVGGTTDAS